MTVSIAKARQAFHRVERIEWRRDFPDKVRLEGLIDNLKAYRALLGRVCENLGIGIQDPCFDVCTAIGVQEMPPPECDPREMLTKSQVPDVIRQLCWYYVRAAFVSPELTTRGMQGVEVYEPLIRMFETGWYFQIHHGDIDFGIVNVPEVVWKRGFPVT